MSRRREFNWRCHEDTLGREMAALLTVDDVKRYVDALPEPVKQRRAMWERGELGPAPARTRRIGRAREERRAVR